MKKKCFAISVLLIMINLIGCAQMTQSKIYYSGRAPRYLYAQSNPTLVVPPDLSSSKIEDHYAIPHAPEASQQPVSIVPPGSLVEQQGITVQPGKTL